jgi:ubiquinone biosynthesis accessory factor UbiJ
MVSLSASALNHILTQNDWALSRLTKFVGKTARFHIAPFSFAYTIQENGTLHIADEHSEADVVCTIPAGLLPRLVIKDETAFTQIQSSGDAALLAEIFLFSRNLRWDAAEDISKLTGNIAAERLLNQVRQSRNQLGESVGGFASALVEYWTEERPLLAKTNVISRFVVQVDTLRDDVARLEQRINRLTK